MAVIAPDAGAGAGDRAARTPRGVAPVLMLAVVALGMALPPLLAKTGFYYWDDSAAVAVPCPHPAAPPSQPCAV